MADADTSLAALLRSTVEDVRELMREEFALAQAELRHDLTAASTAATAFGGALAVAWYAGLLILMSVSFGIAAAFDWPYWAAFGVVGVLAAVIAGVLAMSGRRSWQSVRGLPRTVKTVKETIR